MFQRSGFVFAALLALAIYAFWPPYFSKLPAGGDVYMHAHTALMICWMLLLVAQPFLIKMRRYDLHRRVGRSAFVLVPLAVVAAILLAHSRFTAIPANEFSSAAAFLYLPLAATFLFAVTGALGLVLRQTPLLHARLMVCTSLTLIDPLVARILGHRFPPLENDLHYALIGYGITDLALLALVLADRQSGGRAVFATMLVIFGTVHAGYFTLAQTGAWLGLASAFTALPLT